MMGTPVFRFLNYYCCGTISYGFVRSVTYDWDGMRRYYQKSTGSYEKKEKLVVDKVGSVLFSTVAALSCWPFYLSRDLMRLECAVRGKAAAEYGE